MRKTVFLSSTADLSCHRAQIIADARGHDWFRLDAKLTAAQKEWIALFEAALKKTDKAKRWWKFW